MREAPGRDPMELLCSHVQSRQLLLVLDNCEHLIDTCAQFSAELLRVSSALRILATSRQPLGIRGEVTWRVPSLPAPDPALMPEAEKDPLSILMSYEAAQLFVERMAEVGGNRRFTPSSLQAIARLCHRLDGIPLALELAAARARVLSVEQLVARLDDRFQLLTGGDRAALPRHQTLRATMEWSYGLLTLPEQELLARLSVFAGGWTLESAEAVCSVADGGEPARQHPEAGPQGAVLDHLTALVDKSLVVVTQGSQGSRYRLLETVRAFAAEQLTGEERARTGRRHAERFLSLSEQAEQELKGPRQVEWLDRLETEHSSGASAGSPVAARMEGCWVSGWQPRWSVSGGSGGTSRRAAAGWRPRWPWSMGASPLHKTAAHPRPETASAPCHCPR
jgi:non-specific serine/threonine protein kinase